MAHYIGLVTINTHWTNMDQYGYTSGLAIVETLRSMRPRWATNDPLLTTMGTSYPSVIDNMSYMSQYGDLRAIVGPPCILDYPHGPVVLGGVQIKHGYLLYIQIIHNPYVRLRWCHRAP